MVTMVERMAKVETKLDSISEKLDKFIEGADKKYANKLTERIVYGLVTLILVAFVTKLLSLW